MAETISTNAIAGLLDQSKVYIYNILSKFIESFDLADSTSMNNVVWDSNLSQG